MKDGLICGIGVMGWGGFFFLKFKVFLLLSCLKNINSKFPMTGIYGLLKSFLYSLHMCFSFKTPFKFSAQRSEFPSSVTTIPELFLKIPFLNLTIDVFSTDFFLNIMFWM